jgi:hypothetical protein
MNKIRLTVLSSVLAISAASFFYFTSPYAKKYVELEGPAEKPAYSAHEGRQQYWQELHANVNTGIVETEDFDRAFAAVRAMASKKSSSNLSFIEEGPNNVGGRTRGIAVDKNNTNIIYAGSVSGGLFKSTNKGGSWQPVKGFTDAINALGIGDGVMSISTMDITVDGTLYVGTGGSLVGEGGLANGGSGSQGGRGIFMSKDGGVTFTRLATTNNWDVTRISAHPTQNKIFITGVNRGVTIYNGTSFSTATGAVAGESLTDVRVSPDGNVVIAGRASTYLSTDGGSTFVSVTGAASANKIGSGQNARYAISHEKNANGKYNIYASLVTGGSLAGIWMSTDSGVNWYLIGPGGSSTFQPFGPYGQGWYDNIITVVKGRPNECILGGIDLWHWKLATNLSNPSGQWTSISQWFASPFSPKYVHADQHEMTWDKDGNLYFGNDGGVFTFIPPFPNDVQFISFKHLVKNYNTVQFYAMSNGPNGEMLGGTQDNGTQLNNHTLFDYSSTYEVIGGDGFDCEISQINADAMIGSLYYTGLIRSDDGFNNGSSVNVPCPAGTAGSAGGGCGSFNTNFTLQEILNDVNTKDSVNFEFTEDVTLLDGQTYTFTYASANFAIELNGSYTNNTGGTVNFERGDILRVPDFVQALFAVSIPGLGVFVTRDIWKYGQNPEWWKVLGPENGFTSSATSLKFSRDGQYLYIGTSNAQVWRVDGIGNAYDNRTANLNGAFNINPQDNNRAVIDKIDASIIAVDQVNRTFTVSGDFVGVVLPGRQIRITGAGTNNGLYTVSTVTANGADTDIRVSGTGNLPNGTPGGLINIYYTAPFSLDFYNNTYYDVIDGSQIRFKISRTQIFSGAGSQSVTEIAVDPNDPANVVITLGGFGAGTNVARSTTASTATTTTSFTNIHGSGASALPLMPAYSAVIDKDNSNKIYVGTVFGLFYTLNGGTTWVENNEDFGRVPVFEVRQDVNAYNVGTQLEGAIYIATHGRGMWSTNKFLSTQEITPAADQKLKSGLSLYPNPSSDIINLTYELMNSSQVVVNIVTIEGKVAKQVNIGNQALGKHRSNINVQDLPKGLYIVQVKTATDSKVAKFIKN